MNGPAIENGTHYRRDVTLGEDACRTADRQGAAVLTSLRNLAIGVYELEGEQGRTAVDTLKSWCQRQTLSTVWPIVQRSATGHGPDRDGSVGHDRFALGQDETRAGSLIDPGRASGASKGLQAHGTPALNAGFCDQPLRQGAQPPPRIQVNQPRSHRLPADIRLVA